MDNVKLLLDRITNRVNANLKEFQFDTHTFVDNTIEFDKLTKFYCFYGITSRHPIYFNFTNSCMAGSYFLGKANVRQSCIYKSDVRGDELKRKGDILDKNNPLPLVDDEVFVITGSLLYKTLVHSNSHNPETPEEFTIRNTISAHYANIHGSTLEGCFLGPFATVDLMNLHSCVLGAFSYVQADEFFHRKIEPGVVWIETKSFKFKFKHEQDVLDKYIGVNEKYQPRGLIYEFVDEKETEYERLFEVVDLKPIKAPASSAVNRYAVIKPKTEIGANVLISQRAYVENSKMGDGSNAQENTFIINSHLEGMCITAHGGKIINAFIGLKTFVGFNSFLFGKEHAKLTIGQGCIVMPHTIIDIKEPLNIPKHLLVWGYITCTSDLAKNSIPIDELRGFRGAETIGDMTFTGSGEEFVNVFNHRIERILEANGAYCNGNGEMCGHAQDDQQISFNTLQPYRSGGNSGIYPTIRILP
ncbi:transferase [uncultured Desulfobacter sp.]|uniref:transferase n=1 Tax=uncultured Desulfobacter sp. TaxID=240139 RepID=UPI002AAB0DAA|nr:transferase [uncultured Desulfobacter sp.]